MGEYFESAIIQFILYQTPAGAFQALNEIMSMEEAEAMIKKLLAEKKIVYAELGDQKVIDRGSVEPIN